MQTPDHPSRSKNSVARILAVERTDIDEKATRLETEEPGDQAVFTLLTEIP